MRVSVVVFLIVCSLLGSCKSKKESGCDAYGSVTPVHNDTLKNNFKKGVDILK